MKGFMEKYTVEVNGEGMTITSGRGTTFSFTALEALMLLDILRNEESKLRKAADQASPLPLKVKPPS